MYLSREKMWTYRQKVKDMRDAAAEVQICATLDLILSRISAGMPIQGEITSPDVKRISVALGIELGEYDAKTDTTPVSLAVED